MNLEATFEKYDPKTGEVIANYKNFTADEVFAVVDAAVATSERWQEFGLPPARPLYLNGQPT